MLLTSASAVLLVLAGAFCLLAALALGRAFAAYRHSRYGAVSWFDARRWPVFVLPALSGAGVGALLTRTDFAAAVQLGLGVLIGSGLLLLMAALALRNRVVVGTGGISTTAQLVRWSVVDDYAELPRGLVVFHRSGPHRRRLDLPVPRRHRARVAQITAACLDARFEYAARIYAGHQALEG